MTQRRVAITGLGVVAPIGNNVDELFGNLLHGRSGVRRLTTGRGERLHFPIGAPVDFQPQSHFAGARLRMLDRVSQ